MMPKQKHGIEARKYSAALGPFRMLVEALRGPLLNIYQLQWIRKAIYQVQLLIMLEASLIENFLVFILYGPYTFLPVDGLVGHGPPDTSAFGVAIFRLGSITDLSPYLFKFHMQALHFTCDLLDKLLLSPFFNRPGYPLDESQLEDGVHYLEAVVQQGGIFFLHLSSRRFSVFAD